MKEELQIIKAYVEGSLNINDFKYDLGNKIKLQKLLNMPFDKAYTAYAKYNYNVYEYLITNFPLNKSWDTIRIRFVVYAELSRFLKWFKVPYNNSFTKYKNDYDLLLDMQPSWLDCDDDQGILDKIIAELPKDLSRTKQIAWGKAKIKELFRYDKTYPRWIQSPEWPIVNGKPLVFSHQRKAGKDDERTFYYFYDPDTKEETVITQMY